LILREELKIRDSKIKDKDSTTHDVEYKFYLNEKEHFEKPKFSTEFLVDIIKQKSSEDLTFLDVGCANGALLTYVEHIFPKWNLIGVDVSADLVNDAKVRNVKAKFIVDDFMLPNELSVKADIVQAAGIINIFEDPKIFIDSLINMSNPQASIFIHGIFNPSDVDVLVKYRDYSRADVDTNEPFEGIWNDFSIKCVSNILDKNTLVKSYKFHELVFPDDMVRGKDLSDLHRSWTIKCDDKVQFTNGLNIIQHQYWLEIILK